jgi:hypothetical protein
LCGILPLALRAPFSLPWRVVDKYALPQNGTGFRTERGCVGVWVPSPALVVIALHGHGEGSFAAPIIAAYESLSPNERIRLYADCEALGNYDSPLRTQLTARFLPDRSRIATLNCLVKSRFVSMGVTVMNLALGGIVDSTTDRAKFIAELDACLFEQRVVGFSSNALSAVRFGALAAHA